ncbi:MAG: hypothetical protein R3F43_27385 [bacterium]
MTARRSHWAVQYFERVLDAVPDGPRLRYLPDPEEVGAALAAWLEDEAIATAFFGDPERLSEDVHAAAAAAWLDQMGPTLATGAPGLPSP